MDKFDNFLTLGWNRGIHGIDQNLASLPWGQEKKTKIRAKVILI
jgi:hypothetical protein